MIGFSAELFPRVSKRCFVAPMLRNERGFFLQGKIPSRSSPFESLLWAWKNSIKSKPSFIRGGKQGQIAKDSESPVVLSQSQ